MIYEHYHTLNPKKQVINKSLYIMLITFLIFFFITSLVLGIVSSLYV